MTPKLALVEDKPKDEYPDQIAVARITAQCLVQMPLDEMARRADDDYEKSLLQSDYEATKKLQADREILDVFLFAQKQLKKIEARRAR